MQLTESGITGGSGDDLQPLPEGVGMDSIPLRRLWRVLRYAGFCRPVNA